MPGMIGEYGAAIATVVALPTWRLKLRALWSRFRYRNHPDTIEGHRVLGMKE